MTTRADTALLIDKARTLVEALPYITAFSGKVVVVKYGGNAMTDPALALSFARDVVLMHYVGMRPVVVHGGGPQISDLMRRLDQQPTFVGGYRVTGEAELDVVQMVLQKTNKELVAMLNAHGDLAVGISGEDANLIRARRMTGEGGADLGYVGVVDRIDPRVLDGLLGSGFVPVVAPMGVDGHGQVFNINADHAAAAVATALGAAKLVFLTDVE
ncbi:MAG: acetylglutamate kinase, partial [Actinomycetota bacterium]